VRYSVDTCLHLHVLPRCTHNHSHTHTLFFSHAHTHSQLAVYASDWRENVKSKPACHKRYIEAVAGDINGNPQLICNYIQAQVRSVCVYVCVCVCSDVLFMPMTHFASLQFTHTPHTPHFHTKYTYTRHYHTTHTHTILLHKHTLPYYTHTHYHTTHTHSPPSKAWKSQMFSPASSRRFLFWKTSTQTVPWGTSGAAARSSWRSRTLFVCVWVLFLLVHECVYDRSRTHTHSLA
jgi:hypothetical protein